MIRVSNGLALDIVLAFDHARRLTPSISNGIWTGTLYIAPTTARTGFPFDRFLHPSLTPYVCEKTFFIQWDYVPAANVSVNRQQSQS